MTTAIFGLRIRQARLLRNLTGKAQVELPVWRSPGARGELEIGRSPNRPWRITTVIPQRSMVARRLVTGWPDRMPRRTRVMAAAVTGSHPVLAAAICTGGNGR